MYRANQISSVPITFTPHPALYRMGSEPAPQPPASAASPYQRLKELDDLLDRGKENLAETRRVYQQTLKEFAALCHQLWKEEKAQGSRQGKGFRSHLREAGIKVGRAYRAMTKFFPADFPAPLRSSRSAVNEAVSASSHSLASGGPLGRRERSDVKDGLAPVTDSHASSKPKTAKALTSSAADEVAFRFTGQRQDGKEVLQCTFTLTATEKAELESYLMRVDASQVQRLLLEAVKQAAARPAVAHNHRSEIANNDKGCCTVSPAGKAPVSGAVGAGKGSLSPVTYDLSPVPNTVAPDSEGQLLRDGPSTLSTPDRAPQRFDPDTFAEVVRLIRLQDNLQLLLGPPPGLLPDEDWIAEIVKSSRSETAGKYGVGYGVTPVRASAGRTDSKPTSCYGRLALSAANKAG